MAYAVTKTQFPEEAKTTIVKATSQAHTLTDNVDQGPTQLEHVYVVNDQYTSKVYAKFWDKADPVAGTDAPAFQFPVAASDDRSWFFKNCKVVNALSFGVSKTAGTACTTAPGTPPDVYVVTNGGE
jgi:hypothetical protein